MIKRKSESALSPPHLVADPPGEKTHELLGLEALNMPVLDGIPAQEVVQLGGQHGAHHLLIVGWLFTCNKTKGPNIKSLHTSVQRETLWIFKLDHSLNLIGQTHYPKWWVTGCDWLSVHWEAGPYFKHTSFFLMCIIFFCMQLILEDLFLLLETKSIEASFYFCTF